ncbi:hypothetical protein CTI12_AA341120 [Artemisia annua]|uniref:Uncharacterized protein n=1 Tax=Artemisia annua TaxID=35608 RepID=A0A2U1MHX4_ARTAN|nr:hypothetical protein CTI12_AA341120 [Artemisia annua]
MERFLRIASFVGPTVTGDAHRQARHYKWGLKHWVLDRIVNTDYDDVSLVCDAARNIELLHESGVSNKRNRDGDRIQSGSSGQQNQGSDHRGHSEQSFDHRSRSDRQHEYRDSLTGDMTRVDRFREVLIIDLRVDRVTGRVTPTRQTVFEGQPAEQVLGFWIFASAVSFGELVGSL